MLKLFKAGTNLFWNYSLHTGEQDEQVCYLTALLGNTKGISPEILCHKFALLVIASISLQKASNKRNGDRFCSDY